ncbi:MAG TPA: hypothetical protein VL371_09475 [Gemmataceae bacterium]|jgi:hypothetical protein|nr:hypothetical protein [Gemmataceae bacterium]
MEPPLLTSQGFAVADLWVPPFEVRRGDCLELRFPMYGDEAGVAESLAGLRGPLEGLHRTAVCRYVRPARDSRGLLARWLTPSPTALDWLRPFTQSGDQASALLRNFDVDPTWRLNQMACNPRTLLGLAAVWSADVDVVILSLAGCDPVGRQRVSRLIMSRVERWAAIELTQPFLHMGQQWPGQATLPAARLAEVQRRRPVLVA